VSRTAALVLAALMLAGCADYRLIRDGRIETDIAAEIKHELVTLRGFEREVPLVAVAPAVAREMLVRELRREYEPDELQRIARVYAALGLIPAGLDLERTFLDLYAGQLAGFYDPIGARMVLVEGATAPGLMMRAVQGLLRRDLAGELILAHELTHALQDQHFGLDLGRAELGEDDAQLARRAVYEGDAMLAGIGVVKGGLSPRTAVRLARQLEGLGPQLADAHPDVPAIVREPLVFQYVAGTNFVSWAFDQAGWTGVNALLVNPPRSTEQVLHPEKYYVRPEYPLTIRLGALAPYQRSDWHVVDETTLGELVIRILAAQFLPDERASAVAEGWDGDRMSAMIRGDEVALVWMSAWDSEDDAREFFTAYRSILARKHGEGGAQGGGDVVVRSGAQPYYLERRSDKVLALEGPLEDDLTELADRVWRRSTFQATLPWIPLDMAEGARRTRRHAAIAR